MLHLFSRNIRIQYSIWSNNSFLCKNVQNETIVHTIILIIIQSFIISVVDLRRNFVAIDSFIWLVVQLYQNLFIDESCRYNL